jgi:hypothetical protein
MGGCGTAFFILELEWRSGIYSFSQLESGGFLGL